MANDKIVYCDECSYEWPYKDTKVEETRWKDDKGELFVTTSFKCPQCGKEYLICVDNEITLSERGEIAKTHKAIQIAVKKRSGDVYLYLVKKIERIQVRLNKHQEQLEEAYLSRMADGLLVKETE